MAPPETGNVEWAHSLTTISLSLFGAGRVAFASAMAEYLIEAVVVRQDRLAQFLDSATFKA